MPRSLPTRKSTTPAFCLRVERLDDRITPTVAPFVSFADQQTFAAGSVPVATAVGDFNGDGKPDVAVLNGSAGTVSILLNSTAAGATSATFAAPQTVALGTGVTARAMAVGDLNLDGRPDIVVVGQQGQDGIVVGLLNATAAGASGATFALSDTRSPGFDPTAVVLGDFDGDGRPDIATANRDSNTVSLLMNATAMGSARLDITPFWLFDANPRPSAITAGDFNADGRLDIAVANQADARVANQAGNAVSVLLNVSPGDRQPVQFAAPQVLIALFGTPVSLATADINRDGRPDIVVANAGDAGQAGTVTVLPNMMVAGSPDVRFGQDQNYFVGVGPTSVTVTDFGGTGFPSIVVANATDGTVSLLQNWFGSFTDQRTFAVGGGVSAVANGDFNADGLPDLVAANAGDGTVSVLVNTSVGGLSQFVAGRSENWHLLATGTSPANTPDGNWQILQSYPVNAVAATPGGGVVFNQPPRYPFEGGAITPGAIWYSPPTGGWQQLAGGNFLATALTIDPQGNVWAAFAGSGVGVYRRATGTWDGLPGMTDVADHLAVSANGDVFADFVGLGVYRYRSINGWQQINGHDATSLNVDANGSVVANFAGFGVGQYIPYAHGWRQLSDTTASAITVDASGTVFASWDGGGISGVSRWSAAAGSWELVAASAPATSLATDLFGNVYLSSTGYGLWKFVPGLGWSQLKTSDYGTPGVSMLGVFTAPFLYGPHDTFNPPGVLRQVTDNAG